MRESSDSERQASANHIGISRVFRLMHVISHNVTPRWNLAQFYLDASRKMGWVLVGSEIEGEFPLRAHQQLSLIVRDACLVPVDARPADASLVLGVLSE